jgi:hypothetical protein
MADTTITTSTTSTSTPTSAPAPSPARAPSPAPAPAGTAGTVRTTERSSGIDRALPWVVGVLALIVVALLPHSCKTQVIRDNNQVPAAGQATSVAPSAATTTPSNPPASSRMWFQEVLKENLEIVAFERIENDPIDGSFWLPITRMSDGSKGMLASKPGLPAPNFRIPDGVPIPSGTLQPRSKPHVTGQTIWIVK